MRFIDKVKKKLKNGTWYPFYNSFYERAAPDSRMILLESRSGKALESNILAILKELPDGALPLFSTGAVRARGCCRRDCRKTEAVFHSCG